jgi:hypothetical protein
MGIDDRLADADELLDDVPEDRMIALWDRYWAWVGGNVGAMPLQFLITVGAGLAFLKPLKKLWRRMVGEKADLDDVRRAAAAAHRIAADLHEKMTGEAHRDAPDKEKP